MATAATTPAASARSNAPAAPAAPSALEVAAPVAPALDPAVEIAQLKARLAQLEPVSDNAPASESGPVAETINMGGLVIEKTVDEDGTCQTNVLKQPMIDRELIRATKASQRQAGF